MTSSYYEHMRVEIAPLLPPTARRIVDVGCGSGATLAWLRGLYPSAHTIGLEGNGEVRAQLSLNASEVHILDLTGEAPDLGSPDLILFLDVLEHLPDPAATLSRLASQLAPGGAIIVSLPNVAHLSVALPLILKGEFKYTDEGILDRTHLKFFTQASALALMEDAGFQVDRGIMTGLDGPRARLLDAVTLHRLRPRLTKQFVMRGSRGKPGATRRSIGWSIAASKPVGV